MLRSTPEGGFTTDTPVYRTDTGTDARTGTAAQGANAAPPAPATGGLPAPQAGAPTATPPHAVVQGAPGAPGAPPQMFERQRRYAIDLGPLNAGLMHPLQLQQLQQQLLQWATPHAPVPFMPQQHVAEPFHLHAQQAPPWAMAGMPPPLELPPAVGSDMWQHSAAQAFPAQHPAPAGSLPHQTVPRLHARPTPLPHMGHTSASGHPPSRYTRDRLFETSDLKLSTASGRELDDLARWLPDCRAPAITLDGNEAATVAVVLHALRSNLTEVTLAIECSIDRFAPELISRLTALLKSQTPLTSLTLVLRDGDGPDGKFVLDQAFLKALFGHRHLEDIHLLCNEQETLWLHDPQQLADRVRDNRRLQTLNFECCGELHKLFKAIAPGLEGNRSIYSLSLRHSYMTGCGSAMASVLKVNQTLKQLDMQFTADWGPGDLQQIVQAMAVNTAVEQFHFFHAGEQSNSRTQNEPRPLGTAIGAMLTANQQLRALSIECKLDLANLTPIRQGLNANTSLQSLDLGSIAGTENSEGTTDAVDAINELFATNSRLAWVTLRPPGRSGVTDETVGIRGLVRNRSVHTLVLEDADSVDGLKRLLNSNPRITHLTLTNYLRNKVSYHAMAEILEDIAFAIDGNTTLLEFAFEHDDVDLLRDPRVIAALTRFDELTARNNQRDKQRRQQLQRVSAPATGIGLLNQFRRNEEASWPALGSEEARAIASAIDTVLPQDEAQRVLDVLRFADIRASSSPPAIEPQSTGNTWTPAKNKM